MHPRIRQHVSLRLIVMLVWGAFAVVLTTQSARMPLIQLMRATIASTEVGATIGHVGLFAILTAVGCLGVARWLPGLHGLLVVMLLALVLSTATELYQLVLADRDASLADLLANWLGVFVVGFGIAAWRLASKQRRRHPTTA
jgi:hypothetical protein